MKAFGRQKDDLSAHHLKVRQRIFARALPEHPLFLIGERDDEWAFPGQGPFLRWRFAEELYPSQAGASKYVSVFMPKGTKVIAFPGLSRSEPSLRKQPNRRANDALRTRKHLTETEVEALLAVARTGRHGVRDELMVRMAFRHGLRVSELVGMRWSDLDLSSGTIYVRRLKGSKASTHYIQADDDLLLRVLAERATTEAVFVSERGTPMTAAGFRKQLRRWGEKAGIAFPVHPHQLRHACGYALANRGMDTRSLQVYLGHSSIRHTVRYTEVSLTRFRGIWS